MWNEALSSLGQDWHTSTLTTVSKLYFINPYGEIQPQRSTHPKYFGALRSHGTVPQDHMQFCAWCLGLKAATGVLPNMHVFRGGRKVKHPEETHEQREHKIRRRKTPVSPGGFQTKTYFM